jgi:hypothetical protein
MAGLALQLVVPTTVAASILGQKVGGGDAETLVWMAG